jgi:hypothetical protein
VTLSIVVDVNAFSALKLTLTQTLRQAWRIVSVAKIRHATQTAVCLAIGHDDVGRVMQKVMAALPSAEFGQVRPLSRMRAAALA